MSYEEIVMKYFGAWIENDIEVLKSIFSDEIIYGESYGAEYHGIEQVLNWFIDWNNEGKVLEWSIKRFILEDNTVVVEWYFNCNYKNVIDGFDGVSIIDFDSNKKIKCLKEYQSKTEHFFPYER